MKWTTNQRKVSELIPYDINPRKMSDDDNAALEDSLRKFDLVEIPVINLNGKLLAGHQRIRIMKQLGKGGETIDVRVPDKMLSVADEREYLIRSNKNTGDWDDNILANEFEMTELESFGFDPEYFTGATEEYNNGTSEDNSGDGKTVKCPECGADVEI